MYVTVANWNVIQYTTGSMCNCFNKGIYGRKRGILSSTCAKQLCRRCGIYSVFYSQKSETSSTDPLMCHVAPNSDSIRKRYVSNARSTLDPMYDEGCPHRIAYKSNCDLRPE